MYRLRKSIDRGAANFGWLDARHSFSFGQYFDPSNMNFRALRVINEDWIAPGAGFGEHPHESMEIVTYVLEGALRHQDSLGNGSIIRPGDVQRMSAGSGVRHSEYNASPTDPVRLLQIWLTPAAPGGPPGYEQKSFGDARRGRLALVASPDGRDGSVTIQQDARIYAGQFKDGERFAHDFAEGRHGWLQIVNGGFEVEGEILQAGDGLAMSEVARLEAVALADAEALMFDLS